MVAPYIDLEIYYDAPTVEPGFALVSELARQPAIWKVRFSNELDRPDQGLCWQLRYRDDDAEAGSSICGCSATITPAFARRLSSVPGRASASRAGSRSGDRRCPTRARPMMRAPRAPSSQKP